MIGIHPQDQLLKREASSMKQRTKTSGHLSLGISREHLISIPPKHKWERSRVRAVETLWDKLILKNSRT
jgi:hypothetical protein